MPVMAASERIVELIKSPAAMVILLQRKFLVFDDHIHAHFGIGMNNGVNQNLYRHEARKGDVPRHFPRYHIICNIVDDITVTGAQ